MMETLFVNVHNWLNNLSINYQTRLAKALLFLWPSSLLVLCVCKLTTSSSFCTRCILYWIWNSSKALSNKFYFITLDFEVNWGFIKAMLLVSYKTRDFLWRQFFRVDTEESIGFWEDSIFTFEINSSTLTLMVFCEQASMLCFRHSDNLQSPVFIMACLKSYSLTSFSG